MFDLAKLMRWLTVERIFWLGSSIFSWVEAHAIRGLSCARLLVQQMGRERLTTAGGRGRQSRLTIIDAADVGGRRKLVLIRRDNLEHLVMIGGPSDVLIKSNIARAGASREVAPPPFPARRRHTAAR